MPLDQRKVNHLLALRKRAKPFRSQDVNFTCKNSDGTTTVHTIDVIWRVVGDSDPSTAGAVSLKTGDVLCQIDYSDMDLPTVRSIISAELPPGSPGAQPATRYIPMGEPLPKGMLAGGDHFLLTFERQR